MPIRKIPIGNRAVTGMHARSGARYESSLERDFFELMTADPTVDKVEEQPVQINYATSDGAQRRYTPDALVTFRADPTGAVAKPLLCEIKYREEYKAKFQELKARFQAARRYAREKGWRFCVVTDREIRTFRFANLRFLSGFALGRLEVSAKGNSVNLIVDDLRHLDIVRGKSKEASVSKDIGGSEPSKTRMDDVD